MRAFFEQQSALLGRIRSFPFEEKNAYVEFLAQTRHYVVHTTRLLGLVASRIGPEREKLHFRFMKHAAEERSHHLLAEHDIAALGGDIFAHPELPATSALYETQYYRVEHRVPTMIFGYILALEGTAVLHGGWVHEIVSRTHGEAASTFVKVHANDDPDHLEKAFEAIASLSSDEQALIQANFLHTCVLYQGVLDTIAAGDRRPEGR